ncbi:unnamed protein product [Camellia sinensis]
MNLLSLLSSYKPQCYLFLKAHLLFLILSISLSEAERMVVVPSFSAELYLSFAISVIGLLYLFLVFLESRWSNEFPQDSCFPPIITERLPSLADSYTLSSMRSKKFSSICR